jgi:formylglycine-generating enzyme
MKMGENSMKNLILTVLFASLALFAGKLHINFNDGTPSVVIDFIDLKNIEIAYGSALDNMVFIEGGNFQMGDYFEEGMTNEEPVHSVTLSSFYMSKFLVTQKEWTEHMPAGTYDYGQGDDYPAYGLSWYGAVKYCNLRSIAEKLTPVYSIDGSADPADWGGVPSGQNAVWDGAVCDWSANGYRLPTEAEWEYAARGGIHYTDRYRYSGCHETDDLTNYAWYSGNNSPYGSKPVGTKLSNQIGLYDMSGNLFEWCWDWYSDLYYQECDEQETVTDPYGPFPGEDRVLRGGVWNFDASESRVSFRNFHGPSYKYGSFGFRIVRTSLQ